GAQYARAVEAFLAYGGAIVAGVGQAEVGRHDIARDVVWRRLSGDAAGRPTHDHAHGGADLHFFRAARKAYLRTVGGVRVDGLDVQNGRLGLGFVGRFVQRGTHALDRPVVVQYDAVDGSRLGRRVCVGMHGACLPRGRCVN